MEVMRLQAKPRTGLGKKDTKAVRKEELVPCVLYGSEEIKHFTLVPLDLRELVYSPKFKKVEIEVEGEVIECILKDVQYHPVAERIQLSVGDLGRRRILHRRPLRPPRGGRAKPRHQRIGRVGHVVSLRSRGRAHRCVAR